MQNSRRNRPLPSTQPLIWRIVRRFLFGTVPLEERLWYLPLPFLLVACGLYVCSPIADGGQSRGEFAESLFLVGSVIIALRLCYGLHTRFRGGRRKLSAIVQVVVGFVVIWGTWSALTHQSIYDPESILTDASQTFRSVDREAKERATSENSHHLETNVAPTDDPATVRPSDGRSETFDSTDASEWTDSDRMATPNLAQDDQDSTAMAPDKISAMIWLWVYPLVFGVMFAMPISLSLPLIFLFVEELFDTSTVVKWTAIGLITVLGAVVAIYVYVPEELPSKVFVIGLPLFMAAYVCFCVLTAGVKDTRLLARINRWFEVFHAIGRVGALFAVGATLYFLSEPLQKLFDNHQAAGYALMGAVVLSGGLDCAAVLVTNERRRAKIRKAEAITILATMAAALFVFAYDQSKTKEPLLMWLCIACGGYCLLHLMLTLRTKSEPR